MNSLKQQPVIVPFSSGLELVVFDNGFFLRHSKHKNLASPESVGIKHGTIRFATMLMYVKHALSNSFSGYRAKKEIMNLEFTIDSIVYGKKIPQNPRLDRLYS